MHMHILQMQSEQECTPSPIIYEQTRTAHQQNNKSFSGPLHGVRVMQSTRCFAASSAESVCTEHDSATSSAYLRIHCMCLDKLFGT
jgi:hypothetical protein